MDVHLRFFKWERFHQIPSSCDRCCKVVTTMTFLVPSRHGRGPWAIVLALLAVVTLLQLPHSCHADNGDAVHVDSGSANPSRWDLVKSDPDRDGRFLNVPIYYGDWIPITNAKAIVENVAANIQKVQQPERLEVPPVPVKKDPGFLDRVDVQTAPEVPSDEAEVEKTVPRSLPNQKPNLHGQQHRHRQPRPFWRGGNKRTRRPVPFRRQDNTYRRTRKLPGPTSFVSQITSLFGGNQPQNNFPRRDPSLPTPPAGPGKTPPRGSDSLPAESAFSSIINIPKLFAPKPHHNHLRKGTTGPKPGPLATNPPVTPPRSVPQNHPEPIIKLIPAPDLSQVSDVKRETIFKPVYLRLWFMVANILV